MTPEDCEESTVPLIAFHAEGDCLVPYSGNPPGVDPCIASVTTQPGAEDELEHQHCEDRPHSWEGVQKSFRDPAHHRNDVQQPQNAQHPHGTED